MTITLLAPDGVATTAQQERQAKAPLNGGGFGRPLGGRSGFRVDVSSTVLVATTTTWTLKPCAVMLDPGATTHQGMYGWSSDSDITGAVTAADATYARKDIVYILVNDSTAGDGSGATSAPVVYLAGTPSATPSAPAVPPRGFLLGTITVPQVGGGSPTVAINSARFVAAGGILPVTSAADRPTSPYVGQQVCRLDREGWIQTYTGNTTLSASGWEYKGAPRRVTANVSTFTNASGNNDRLLLTMPDTPGGAGALIKPYPQKYKAFLKLSINCGSITSGVLVVNAAVSGGQPSAALAQSKASIAWTAPGAYLQTASVETDWLTVAAGGNPLIRAWVEVVSGAVTNTVSTLSPYTAFYAELRPDDD
ncbi:virion structural protein [Arthrobacter phage TripleJ]|uniref:Minor tail protein n=1 Tax=Arthrobacter phage TripleJ TaxID=2599838 RepID=A0A5J6THQ0_9CAUD|nr:virion structural protein [Arthrobacter phage TripleJ]QFG09564.1 minor tail protein [Arthrobacter phage TripleJ]